MLRSCREGLYPVRAVKALELGSSIFNSVACAESASAWYSVWRLAPVSFPQLEQAEQGWGHQRETSVEESQRHFQARPYFKPGKGKSKVRTSLSYDRETCDGRAASNGADAEHDGQGNLAP